MEQPNDTQKERRKLFDMAVMEWWKEMQPANEKPGQPNRRGELAELKRCKTLGELLFVPRFQVLRWGLGKAGYNYVPSAAAVAGILARVKQTTDLTFPAWLAQPKSGGEPRLSELRFRRLIGCKTLEEVFPALIRVLPLADETAPIASLANDIYHWNDQTRQRWTFAYYDALAGSE
ncbi:MAG: type I-E CRISPR-associated protein Cse2/CasB [Methylococcaceae bacterium]|nr:type I-E CRISPR-associated protein Cse2/CasB [Methylococcaceae bacterium]